MRLPWPGLRSMTPARLGAIASIVARNAVPVLGIAFFDWRSAHLVLIYYVDTIVSIASLFTLAFMNARELPEGAKLGARDIVGLVIVTVLLTAIYAFALGFPVIVIGGTEGFPLDDESLRAGLLLQLLFACVAFLTMSRELGRAPEPLALVKRRFGFVTLRWVALFAVALFVPWAPLLVVAYAGASIWLELHPEATA